MHLYSYALKQAEAIIGRPLADKEPGVGLDWVPVQLVAVLAPYVQRLYSPPFCPSETMIWDLYPLR